MRRLSQAEVNELMSEAMTFGKYKGKPMCQVPVDYLEWVIDSGLIRSRKIEQAIRQFLGKLSPEERIERLEKGVLRLADSLNVLLRQAGETDCRPFDDLEDLPF